MTSQSNTNVELFAQEVLSGQLQGGSPRLIEAAFYGAIRKDLSNVIDAIADEHKVEGSGSTLKVVHYTSVAVVLSMLESPESNFLRMYSTSGSNDPGEGNYVDTVRSDPERPKLRRGSHSYAYVASFITPDNPHEPDNAADNLAFWRAYGRDGAGCSLIIDLPQQILQAVKYGQQSVRGLYNPIDDLQKTVDIIAGKFGISLQSIFEMVDPTIEKIRYLYKSEAYNYEKECRVIETPPTIEEKGIKPLFDFSGPPGQERVKRYVNHPSLAANQLFVTGSVITLGPNVPHKEETKAYMKDLLRGAGLPGPIIKCSPISYRSSTNHR